VDNPVISVGKSFIKKNFFRSLFAAYFANRLLGKSFLNLSDLPRKDWRMSPKSSAPAAWFNSLSP